MLPGTEQLFTILRIIGVVVGITAGAIGLYSLGQADVVATPPALIAATVNLCLGVAVLLHSAFGLARHGIKLSYV